MKNPARHAGLEIVLRSVSVHGLNDVIKLFRDVVRDVLTVFVLVSAAIVFEVEPEPKVVFTAICICVRLPPRVVGAEEVPISARGLNEHASTWTRWVDLVQVRVIKGDT